MKPNWKTNLLGALALAMALGQIWAPAGLQSKIQQTAAALTAAGLLAAKDYDR